MISQTTVLMISDESEPQEFARESSKDIFEIMTASDYETAMSLIKKYKPRAILLDLKRSFIEICKIIEDIKSNSETNETPVIIFTTNKDKKVLVHYFQSGADDYIEKPFQSEEFIARLKARTKNQQKNTLIQYGSININTDSMQVAVSGTPVNFSKLEFDLLKYFVQNRDHVISRTHLLSSVWPGVKVTDRTVDTHIVSIRKKIKLSNCELKSIYGVGYRFGLKSVEESSIEQTI